MCERLSALWHAMGVSLRRPSSVLSLGVSVVVVLVVMVVPDKVKSFWPVGLKDVMDCGSEGPRVGRESYRRIDK